MNAPSIFTQPIHAMLDGEGHLREADRALLLLQEQAGGAPDGAIAVPALADVVRLAQRLNMAISRAVEVAREDRDISMWVRVVPEGGGLRLSITDWSERPARVIAEDRARALCAAADGARGWAWRIDSRMRFLLADAEKDALGHEPPAAGQALTGYFVLVDDEAAGEQAMPLVEALARRAPFHRQAAVLRADPAVRYLLSGVPLFDLHGHLLGYQGSAARADDEHARTLALTAAANGAADTDKAAPPRDATPLLGADLSRRLDEALRRPLGRIIANASTISSQLEGPLRQDYADYAADIAAAGRHLVALVDDLADLQAIERPGFTTAEEEVDLADLARRAAGLLGVKAADRRISIVTPAIGEKAPARAEYRRVLQILVNLIGNAVRYAPEESSIWVRVDPSEDGRASLIVADQGRGIAPDDHERVFGKFERLGAQESGGSGLGLYISRTLARAMKGDITLESAPGQGARFTLDLPAWD